MSATVGEVAARFESLGGGSLNANGWAFGCEFGFFQRHSGIEPLGLLRWASVATPDLIHALDKEFAGVEDPAHLELIEHTGSDWGAKQTTYALYMDHSHLDRNSVSREKASQAICRNLAYLKSKLIADLAAGEKIFVYRTYDHTLSQNELSALAGAVNRYGNNQLLYVSLAENTSPPFKVARLSGGLLTCKIDRFAPVNGKLEYNDIGWECVCRAVLEFVDN